MTHHKTWFPVIVLALSALLGVFIYSVFKDRIVASHPPAVTNADYQAAVYVAVGSLQSALAAAEDEAAVVARLEQARDRLLSLVVPVEDKDVHLEMVMILARWIDGYHTGDQQKQAEAEIDWNTLIVLDPWIERPLDF